MDMGAVESPYGAPSLTISISDASVQEGDFDTAELNFTVELSQPVPEGGVIFSLATEDDTAAAGEDYKEKTESDVVIPAGSTSYGFTVKVNSDDSYEADETLFINLTNVTGATLVWGQVWVPWSTMMNRPQHGTSRFWILARRP